MERVVDPLIDTLDRVHASILIRVQAVAAGEADKRTFDVVGAQLRALAAAERDVLYPLAEKNSLRFETRQFLSDYRDHRAEQIAALEVLAATTRRSPRLFVQRARQLCELVVRDAAQFAIQVIAVLRSKLPRPLYAALGRAFVTHLGEHALLPAPEEPARQRKAG